MVILASILAFAALPAIWLNRQLLNTDNYTKTSSELLADPVIRDQVAVFLVDQLYETWTSIGAALGAAAQLQPLAGPAAGALRTLAERGSKDILARPRAQQAWEDANRQAQLTLLAILKRRRDRGQRAAATSCSTCGYCSSSWPRGSASAQGRERAPAGRRADPDSPRDQLSAAQDVAKGIRGLPIVLVGLSVLLFIGALFVAPHNRRNTVRAYGVGLIAVGLLMLLVIKLAGDQLVSSLATTAAEPVVEHTWTIVTPLLREATVAGIFYGVVLVFGAWLAGPTSVAVAVRRASAPYLRETLIAWAGSRRSPRRSSCWWAPTPAMHNPVTAIC